MAVWSADNRLFLFIAALSTCHWGADLFWAEGRREGRGNNRIASLVAANLFFWLMNGSNRARFRRGQFGAAARDRLLLLAAAAKGAAGPGFVLLCFVWTHQPRLLCFQRRRDGHYSGRLGMWPGRPAGRRTSPEPSSLTCWRGLMIRANPGAAGS